MTAQPHDAFFKAAFQHPEHARALVQHALPSLSSQFDWTTLRGDPASFVDPALQQHHTDLLFSVQVQGEPAHIYVLFEHQSTVDHDMALRVLNYLARIWKRHRIHRRTGPLPLIVPIVITNAPGGWYGPRWFHDLCSPHPSTIDGIAELIPSFNLHIMELSEYGNEQLRAWALAAFPKAAMFALRDVRDPDKLLQDFEHWGPYVAEAYQAPSGMDAIAQLMRYIAKASPNLNIEAFRAKIGQYLPEAEAELMTIYEQALQEGLQRGIQQGIHQGRVLTLVRLLELKFGELPSEYSARLQRATAEELDRYDERVLTADSLAAVFADPC